MARISRVVAPGHPHHVTQRGVRFIPIFQTDSDRKADLATRNCAGRPAGSEQFIKTIERLTGRDLIMRKAGRPHEYAS
jgi:hypothetical protein